jgi:predicted GIY-YIG superfamily endonuclease
MTPKRFVYVLKAVENHAACYVGPTSDVEQGLACHNQKASHRSQFRQSTQQLQEGHHVGLILFREDESSRTGTIEEEERVELRDVLERLGGVVVEVRSRVLDTP